MPEGRRVLITGGTGFIGSRLALRCLETASPVRVLGQRNTPAETANADLLQARGVQLVIGSVTDYRQVSRAVEGVDIVYHLAAAQHEANVPDQRFRDVNVSGTRNVLEASVEAEVKRFVHGSTIGVYGASGREVISEKSPLAPDNVYGRTKLEAERTVLGFAEKLPVVVLRISETYGPGDYRLLKLFRAIQKKAFVLIGRGENLHHLIYIDDLLESLLSAATAPEVVGGIFVLAGREAVTTREMVRLIAEQLDRPVPGLRLPLAPLWLASLVCEVLCRPLGVQPPLHRRRMDFFRKSFRFSQEAAGTLGVVLKYGAREGLERTAAWYKAMGYL